MNILTFTTLFPNSRNPDFCIFVKNRMAAISRLPGVRLKVVAPVPYFPPLKFFPNWYTNSQIPKQETLDDIEIFHPRYLVTPKIGMTLYGFWMFLGALKCVSNLKRSFDFDLIDAHYVYPDGMAALMLGRFFEKPVVVSARGSDINLYLQLRWVKNLTAHVLKRVDHLISVSSSLGEQMAVSGATLDKLSVIPNGIDSGRFFSIDRNEARQELGLQTNEKILLTVGNLVEGKGIHLLVDALELLRSQNSQDIKAHIIGKGPLYSFLLKKIESLHLQDRVFLHGQIPNQELIHWYNAADVFFLGSSREGWPNVVCEALACGAPVVATKVNGIPEILSDDNLGIMVDRNPEAFAAGITEAFSRNWDNEFIAQKGQSRTWQHVAEEVYDTFSKVLNNAEN